MEEIKREIEDNGKRGSGRGSEGGSVLPLSYAQIAKDIIAKEGLGGLFGRGLQVREKPYITSKPYINLKSHINLKPYFPSKPYVTFKSYITLKPYIIYHVLS